MISLSLTTTVYCVSTEHPEPQARRTGSSSPLGLLFDHGCDAINCCFGVVFVACILNAGWSLPFLAVIVLNQMVPFFFTTWEHYYTNEMILPIINGPSEGVIVGVVLAFFRGACEPKFFSAPRKELNGWTLGELLIACSLSGVALTVLKQLITVMQARRRHNKGMVAPMLDTMGFVALMVTGAVWARSRPSLFLDMPYTMVLLFGLLHVDMSVHIMVCHICDVLCRPFRPILVPFFLVVGNSFFFGGSLIEESSAVWMFTVITALYEMLYLYRVVTETSQALDIFVFKLGKRSELAASKACAVGVPKTNGTAKKTS